MNKAVKIWNLYKKFKVLKEKGKESTIFNTLYSILSFKDSYKTFYSLKNININVDKGEVVGIIGPNGSGKTTLLRTIAGIIKPTFGIVKTEGAIQPIIDLGLEIIPELTGKENIYLAGVMMGLSRKEIDNLYVGIVEFSGLKKFMNVKAKNYSNGMKLRLAFSITTMKDPDILLLDEVFSVGDFKFQKKCVDWMTSLKNDGKTIIIASQDMNLIHMFCDRVMVLNRGEAEFLGAAETGINNYMNLGAEANGDVLSDWGSKDIEIKDARVLDPEGQETAAFEKGSSMVIEIDYVNNKTIPNPMFGIAIYNRGGVVIFGPNTTVDDALPSNINAKGTVRLRIDNIAFNAGVYSLTVAIHDNGGTNCYHRKEKFTRFIIKKNSDKNDAAFSDMKHKWVFK